MALLSALRRPRPFKAESQVQPLAVAARRILEIAQRERLPLAYIAERGGAERAPWFFADNILRVVTVEGRVPSDRHHKAITRDLLQGLELDADMTALRRPGDAQTSFVDLRVSPGEFARYLEFVRTTQ